MKNRNVFAHGEVFDKVTPLDLLHESYAWS